MEQVRGREEVKDTLLRTVLASEEHRSMIVSLFMGLKDFVAVQLAAAEINFLCSLLGLWLCEARSVEDFQSVTSPSG